MNSRPWGYECNFAARATSLLFSPTDIYYGLQPPGGTCAYAYYTLHDRIPVSTLSQPNVAIYTGFILRAYSSPSIQSFTPPEGRIQIQEFRAAISHNIHTQEFDGAARQIILGLRETDARDPQFNLLGLSGDAWEAYKRSRQLEGSEGFDPLGDFVYARCQELVAALPDSVLREWWQRTSEFPYRFGEPPDAEEMREAVADEIWHSVNDWAEQEPLGEDWS